MTWIHSHNRCSHAKEHSLVHPQKSNFPLLNVSLTGSSARQAQHNDMAGKTFHQTLGESFYFHLVGFSSCHPNPSITASVWNVHFKSISTYHNSISPIGAQFSLATDEYIRKRVPFLLMLSLLFIFFFSYSCSNTDFFSPFWPPNLHFSGSTTGKPNKAPSKLSPRAPIQMWSTVWRMKHWSIPSSFPFLL